MRPFHKNKISEQNQPNELSHPRGDLSPAFNEPLPDLVLKVLLDVWPFQHPQVLLDIYEGFLVVLFMFQLHLVPQIRHLLGLDYSITDFVEERGWFLEIKPPKVEALKVTGLQKTLEANQMGCLWRNFTTDTFFKNTSRAQDQSQCEHLRSSHTVRGRDDTCHLTRRCGSKAARTH